MEEVRCSGHGSLDDEQVEDGQVEEGERVEGAEAEGSSSAMAAIDELGYGLQRLQVDVKEEEEESTSYRVYRRRKRTGKRVTGGDSDLLGEAFTPLSPTAKKEVENAMMHSKRKAVLVFHEGSNIEVTGAVLQCLRPHSWLNDEVINVYMELLKERELREPEKFLKCHFFNTFFYNKLFKDAHSYDYQGVRRWTSKKRLGYSLMECDKILVPIHQDVHWCLAVIDMQREKLLYLDSLEGRDSNVLKCLARYIVDEARERAGQNLDVSKWEHVHVDNIPRQLNGCDCGMFMLKYADFHSRGGLLNFQQADMDYFRKRTAWEILQLNAT